MERISVIVPIYNVGEYVGQCIESVLKQTYENLEIILVDDGSQDISGDLCDTYAQQDCRVRVIHQKNLGLVAARKAGMRIATGKYVGFVDGDDWIEPNMYETLYEETIRTGADVVTSGRIIEKEDGTSLFVSDLIGKGVYTPLTDINLCRNMIMWKDGDLWGITPNFWNKLFVKEHLWRFEEGVDERITYGEDDACVYACMAFSNKLSVMEDCLYHYRMRGTSISHSGDDFYLMRVNYLYLAMKNNYVGHPFYNVLENEVEKYMLEFLKRGIDKLCGFHFDIGIPTKFCDLSGGGDKKLVLFGAGIVGQEFYKEFCLLGLKKRILWVDRKYETCRERGLPVDPVESICEVSYDRIVIAAKSDRIHQSMIDDLKAIGADMEKVVYNPPRTWLQILKEI